MQQSYENGIPIVVGVVGHRKIAENDRTALREAFALTLRELAERHPNSSILIATGLAEGSDRLAAEVGLELNHDLLALSPLPQLEYELDFPASISEYRELREKAKYKYDFDALKLATDKQYSDRDSQYALLGRFLSLNCHYLVAFWDGIDSNLEGGTSAVIGYRLGRIAPRAEIDAALGLTTDWVEPNETGPVIHIYTRRGNDEGDSARVGHKRIILPPWASESSLGEEFFNQTFGIQDKLNRRLKRYKMLLGLASNASRKQLLPNNQASIYADMFSKVDAATNQYQRLSRWTLGAMVFLGLTALFFYSTYSDGVILSPKVALTAYALVMAFAWFLFASLLRPRNWQDASLEYRALAEALRIQFYWRQANLSLNVADHFLRKQRDDLTWIRFALRGCYCLAVGTAPAPASASTPTFTHDWIVGQTRYFEKASMRDERRLDIGQSIVRLVLALTFVIIFVQLAVLWGTFDLSSKPMSWLVFLSGLGPAIVAVISYVVETENLEAHVNQYQRMRQIFRHSEIKLGEADNADLTRQVLVTLGKQALSENGEWVSAHKIRRIQPNV